MVASGVTILRRSKCIRANPQEASKGHISLNLVREVEMEYNAEAIARTTRSSIIITKRSHQSVEAFYGGQVQHDA